VQTSDPAVEQKSTGLGVTCAWFHLCENEATHLHDAGPLGQVPICDRCEAKVTEIEKG
jgi:hypothetical protein